MLRLHLVEPRLVVGLYGLLLRLELDLAPLERRRALHLLEQVGLQSFVRLEERLELPLVHRELSHSGLLQLLERLLGRRRRLELLLSALGALHLEPDEVPGYTSLVLLGPAGPDFWPHVTAAPEFADGAPDPLDRWSLRVIGALASDLGARAVFPFDGPPWPSFTGWARRSGRAWSSPVGLLVHDTTGLMLSYRGALALLFPRGCGALPRLSSLLGVALGCVEGTSTSAGLELCSHPQPLT